MPIKNIYAMTDNTIAKEIGGRIEQMILDANKSQAGVAENMGVALKTYRALINGNAKSETIISALRCFNKLELVDTFIPDVPVSPMALLKLEGKKRLRASPEKK